MADRPSHHSLHRNEHEYFAREDQERIREMRARLDAERAEADRAAHLGLCPRCGVKLEKRDHHHVMVDECPQCGGIWLDKGELGMLREVRSEHRVSFFDTLFNLKL